MKKQKEEMYVITPKGLIHYAIGENKNSWDELELYCYRHGFNAMLINKEGGEFINVELDNARDPR